MFLSFSINSNAVWLKIPGCTPKKSALHELLQNGSVDVERNECVNLANLTNSYCVYTGEEPLPWSHFKFCRVDKKVLEQNMPLSDFHTKPKSFVKTMKVSY